MKFKILSQTKNEDVNVKFYSIINLNYKKHIKNVNYKKVLKLFVDLAKEFKVHKFNYLSVVNTYFDEKGFQKTKVAHEYTKNIELKILKIEDEYNLYGIGFETLEYKFMLDWNKNRGIFHISIDSNILINEQIIRNMITFIEGYLLISCEYEIECINKEYTF